MGDGKVDVNKNDYVRRRVVSDLTFQQVTSTCENLLQSSYKLCDLPFHIKFFHLKYVLFGSEPLMKIKIFYQRIHNILKTHVFYTQMCLRNSKTVPGTTMETYFRILEE